MTPARLRFILPAAGWLLLLAPALRSDEIIFDDDFSGLTPGMFSSDVIGAHAEYHYLEATAPKGNWLVSAFRSNGSQRAWRVVRDGAKTVMAQTYTSAKNEALYTHPMVVAGDPLWQDYTVTVRFTPESTAQQIGVMFRYRNDRCYYFFGVLDGKAVLKSVNHATGYRSATETVLAQSPYVPKRDACLVATVTVSGPRISADLDGNVRLQATDATFARGRIGLLSDVPTRYEHVRVTMIPTAAASFRSAAQARQTELSQLEAANPQPLLWRKISTDGFGTGRQLRFGDLNGDGQIDILVVQVKRHGPKDRNSEVGCLTALTVDGNQLWQSGEEDLWNDLLTNDVAVQIHDIDQDGRNEVIYTRDFQLVIAEGATGKVKRKVATPSNRARPPHNKFPQVLGDSIMIANFRGRAAPQDILLKDRYEHFWVYSHELELLWSGGCNTGHYPFAQDVDGDGKDELYIGYSLFDDDGRKLWSLDQQIKDHADGVAIVDLDLNPATPPILLNAASDEGMIFLDTTGRIRRRHHIGHVQNPSVANFRDDLPGLETYTINFWGNQGIIHLFDATGELVFDFEPVGHGSMMAPVNWTGKTEEYFLLSANPAEGGLFDGRGRRVVRFPDDGHPQFANTTLHLTGDCRDELVVWDAGEIWIYTQSDSPRPGRLYQPKRTPLWLESNYGVSVSLPGWNDSAERSRTTAANAAR